ncbi:MAG: hypothetical protein KGZ84_05565 [Erysipelotrichia bacterium]|jgi:hypothetical protein|nr:hypothetical protein [Erysipelotrichia bacterium]
MKLKIKKNKITKSHVASLFIQLFYFLYFIRMIIGTSSIYGITTYVLMSLIGIGSFAYVVTTQKFHSKTKIIVFFFAFYLFGLVSSVYTSNYRVQDYLIIVQYFGIALLLFRYGTKFSINKFFFMFYVLYFGANMLAGIHPDNVFIGFSRNNIPVTLLIQSVLLYVSMFENKKQIKIYPALTVLLFSIWTIGRSGIFTSLLMLILIILYIQFESEKKNLKIIYLSFLILIVYSVISVFFYEELIEPALARLFRLGITDSHRRSIVVEYLNQCKISFYALFFGVNINQNLLFSVYGYNLHNSYLRLHAYHGLLGFIMIFIFSFRSISKFFIHKYFLFFILSVILLIRGVTDIVAFHGPFDPLLYYFIFKSFNIQPKLTKKTLKGVNNNVTSN